MFTDPATHDTYTLSLHDALPIFTVEMEDGPNHMEIRVIDTGSGIPEDRKSTRLNSSHSQISYAVFCVKKKNGRGLNHFVLWPATVVLFAPGGRPQSRRIVGLVPV